MTTTRKPTITAAHRKDIETLATILAEEAENHDLCDEFYAVVKRINAQLTVPLPIVQETLVDFNIVVSVRATVTNFDGSYYSSTFDEKEALVALAEKLNLTSVLSSDSIDVDVEITDISKVH